MTATRLHPAIQRVLGNPDPGGDVHHREATLDHLLHRFGPELIRVLLAVAHKHLGHCHQLWQPDVYERLAGPSEKNMLGLSVSIVLFAGVAVALRSSFFWKAAIVTFGLLGVGQLMLVLGGFEPNLVASTLAHRVLSFEFALLFMFLLSAAMSFASGRKEEKRNRSEAMQK